MLLVAVLLAGCGSSTADDPEDTSTGGEAALQTTVVPDEEPTSAPSTSGERLTVVATTSMLGEVVRAVAGDNADVEVLIPVGADPHDFSPSSQQVAALADADLVVANGLTFEGAFEDVIDSAEGANLVEVAALVDPIPFAVEGDHGEREGHDLDDGHGHDHGEFDPHIHMDPLRMADAADVVAAELTELDPTVDWATGAADFSDEMTALDARIVEILSAVPEERRVLVTLHDAMGYFADRYGFTVVGTVIPGGSTLAEPSSADLAELVHEIEEQDVPAIFAEGTVSATLGEAVGAEVGRPIAVVPLYVDSLGEPGSGADTLAGMLQTNATRIAEALIAER